MGRFGRVCSYDPAGNAWSDPVSAPQILREMSDDLHTLMHHAGETGRFVLVGHSLGAELVRVFAAAWPDDIAGAVLVDTGHPDALEHHLQRSLRPCRRELKRLSRLLISFL